MYFYDVHRVLQGLRCINISVHDVKNESLEIE
jgi:hypothetical protein